jgi:hypothetical protein
VVLEIALGVVLGPSVLGYLLTLGIGMFAGTGFAILGWVDSPLLLAVTLLYLPSLGVRSSIAAGLLQATSLPFIVTATQIGVIVGAVEPVTASALICAKLLSVLVLPAAALALLREGRGDVREPAPATPPPLGKPTTRTDRAVAR